MTQESNSNGKSFGISFSDGKPTIDDGTVLVPDTGDTDKRAFSAPKRQGILLAEDKKPQVSPTDAYIDGIHDTEDDIAHLKKIKKSRFSQKEKKIITLLSVLNVAVFLFIGIYLVVTGGDNEYDIKDNTPEAVVYDPRYAFGGELNTYIKNVPFPDKMQDKFKRLYSENQDSIGWIRINGTSIDYPVLKAVDNDVYLRANFYREYDRRGSIYMDFRNSVAKGRDSLSRVTILWGHHLTLDETIFADVEKYMNADYYKAHPVIQMDTIFDDYKWKVFACATLNATPEGDGGRYFYYWNPSVSVENMPAYINECISRSWFVNPAVDVLPQDKILCLSTCSYILDDKDTRCVLFARLVRAGESENVDVTQAYQNPNKRMPQRYYDINGIANPFYGMPLSAVERTK